MGALLVLYIIILYTRSKILRPNANSRNVNSKLSESAKSAIV